MLRLLDRDRHTVAVRIHDCWQHDLDLVFEFDEEGRVFDPGRIVDGFDDHGHQSGHRCAQFVLHHIGQAGRPGPVCRRREEEPVVQRRDHRPVADSLNLDETQAIIV